ncbi:MAG: hypothetical protein JSW66_13955 [Phycisphaerales bacterium]|nr:MAG: hypothetical protein JSW66_13955 [Phycisphaerales bacterium]
MRRRAWELSAIDDSVGQSIPMPRRFDSEPDLPVGIFDSPGESVRPQSLCLTQLAERLGPQAVKNIGC